MWNGINSTKTTVVIFDSNHAGQYGHDFQIVCTLLKIGCALLEIIDRWNICFGLEILRALNNIFFQSRSKWKS